MWAVATGARGRRNIVAALWPERCKALVSVSGYLIGSRDANKKPLPPQAELQWWYQFYFATERGRVGYETYRREFAKLIWQTASPQWRFDDATFDRSAASFDNPDHVSIVIHNYRWRLGLAEGESTYDALESRLAAGPVIAVPTITLEGDANGAPHPAPAAYAAKFSGKYVHRNVTGGIGHNLPQEAPQAFAGGSHRRGRPFDRPCVSSLECHFMRIILPILFAGIVVGSSLAGAASTLPAFKAERWVNSAPLTAEALRGKVVLVDFWEYTCINWIRTLPFIKAWNRDYAALGLVVSECTRRSSSSASAPRTSTVGFATTG